MERLKVSKALCVVYTDDRTIAESAKIKSLQGPVRGLQNKKFTFQYGEIKSTSR